MSMHFEWIEDKPTNGAGSLAGFEWLGAPSSGMLGAAATTPECVAAMNNPNCKSIDWNAYQTAQVTVINGSAGIMLPDGTQPGTTDYAIKVGAAQAIFDNLTAKCKTCGSTGPGACKPGEIRRADGKCGAIVSISPDCNKAMQDPDCKNSVDWDELNRLLMVANHLPGAMNKPGETDVKAAANFWAMSAKCTQCLESKVPPQPCAAGYERDASGNCVKKTEPPPTTGVVKSGMSTGGILLLAATALAGMYAAWKYGGASKERRAA